MQDHADAPEGVPVRPADTSAEAYAVWLEALRRMTPGQRLAQALALTQAARELALAGIRARHPGASIQELRCRLAALVLERETVREVYGWDPAREGY